MRTEQPHVIVIGGGFGGLAFVRALKRAPVRLTLIDRRNFHLFQPLLYEVATATLSAEDITSTLRSLLRTHRNVEVQLGHAIDVDVRSKRVRLEDGRDIAYDYLLLAPGLRNHYYDHPEWEALAPGLKSIEDALEIRRRFLSAFELAESERDPAIRRSLLTFAVIGAGPTGVELAGAMSEVVREALRGEYRNIDPASSRILLVDAADRVFPTYPPELSAAAEEELRERGIEVRTCARVRQIRPDGVWLGDEFVPCRTVFWGAGVIVAPLAARLGAPTDALGRVRVEPDCSIPGHAEVFVIGDAAHVEIGGRVITGVAPAAVQMAKHAARMISADLAGRPREPFRYHDKGLLATIGRAAGVSRAAGVTISGPLAWLAHVAIHLFYLATLRDKVAVLFQWLRTWLLGKRDARLITRPWQPENAIPIAIDTQRAADAGT